MSHTAKGPAVNDGPDLDRRGPTQRSNAPMSAWLPFTRGKPGPRWSVSSPPTLLPRSIAGLSESSARVGVGPPLSASGASRGSAEIVSGGTGTVEDPIRLFAPWICACRMSAGWSTHRFLATMLLSSSTSSWTHRAPVHTLVFRSRLNTMVLLITALVERFPKIVSPALAGAEFPEIVLSITRTSPSSTSKNAAPPRLRRIAEWEIVLVLAPADQMPPPDGAVLSLISL